MVPNSHAETHTILISDDHREDIPWYGVYEQVSVGDSVLKEASRKDMTTKRPDGSTSSFSLFVEERLWTWD